MIVYTDNGVAIELVEPALGKGGEGAVYKMKDFDRVAKIYTSDAESHRAKIEAMAGMAGDIMADKRLDRVAWPLGALYHDPNRRSFAGFGMRVVKERNNLAQMEEYPSPASCTMNMKQKVSALIELADIMDALHAHGQVMGDVNDENIVICKDGHVGIVDADSFHCVIGNDVHRCVVCMPGYMAPELVQAVKGTTFAATTRPTFSFATDNFSLAVHVFKTLMNGVHPFHSTALPKANGSLPAAVSIEKRVLAGQSPYFTTIPGFRAPAFTPDIRSLGKPVVRLFKKAFVDGASNPNLRPTAAQWKACLEDYRRGLKRCRHGHFYQKSYGKCPYCEAEASKPAPKAVAKPVPNGTVAVAGTPTIDQLVAAARTAPAGKPLTKARYWTLVTAGSALVWYVLTALSSTGLAPSDFLANAQPYQYFTGAATVIGTLAYAGREGGPFTTKRLGIDIAVAFATYLVATLAAVIVNAFILDWEGALTLVCIGLVVAAFIRWPKATLGVGGGLTAATLLLSTFLW